MFNSELRYTVLYSHCVDPWASPVVALVVVGSVRRAVQGRGLHYNYLQMLGGVSTWTGDHTLPAAGSVHIDVGEDHLAGEHNRNGCQKEQLQQLFPNTFQDLKQVFIVPSYTMAKKMSSIVSFGLLDWAGNSTTGRAKKKDAGKLCMCLSA